MGREGGGGKMVMSGIGTEESALRGRNGRKLSHFADIFTKANTHAARYEFLQVGSCAYGGKNTCEWAFANWTHHAN